MSAINLIFPHQLFDTHPLIKNGNPVYLVEEHLFFRQYAFHKQKIAFLRAAMKTFALSLSDQGITVRYIEAFSPLADIRTLIGSLKTKGVKEVHFIDPTDDWLEKRLKRTAHTCGTTLIEYESLLFLNTRKQLTPFFRADKKKFYQTKFYLSQRTERSILLTEDGKPQGGKWTFDTENRKKYPKKKIPPKMASLKADEHHNEAILYVEKYFPDNPGELSLNPLYPTNHSDAENWLTEFLQTRFSEFGAYEDAIVQSEHFLHHSVLSPMMNIGLLTPKKIIQAAIETAIKQDVPINSTEGFIRQIVGWREFMRGVYQVKGREQRTQNFWGFQKKIPPSFYDGSTGILPFDTTLKKVLKTGYCHHIERLMILGNFMLLCEFDPDEVYKWFMELFVDAYDWVMVPNVYGMSQFADGGLLSSKPYISGSNYIKKMSDFPKGEWEGIWDALFWRFMHVHRNFFTKNPRLNMLIGTFDRMEKTRKMNYCLQPKPGSLA